VKEKESYANSIDIVFHDLNLDGPAFIYFCHFRGRRCRRWRKIGNFLYIFCEEGETFLNFRRRMFFGQLKSSKGVRRRNYLEMDYNLGDRIAATMNRRNRNPVTPVYFTF